MNFCPEIAILSGAFSLLEKENFKFDCLNGGSSERNSRENEILHSCFKELIFGFKNERSPEEKISWAVNLFGVLNAASIIGRFSKYKNKDNSFTNESIRNKTDLSPQKDNEFNECLQQDTFSIEDQKLLSLFEIEKFDEMSEWLPSIKFSYIFDIAEHFSLEKYCFKSLFLLSPTRVILFAKEVFDSLTYPKYSILTSMVFEFLSFHSPVLFVSDSSLTEALVQSLDQYVTQYLLNQSNLISQDFILIYIVGFSNLILTHIKNEMLVYDKNNSQNGSSAFKSTMSLKELYACITREKQLNSHTKYISKISSLNSQTVEIILSTLSNIFEKVNLTEKHLSNFTFNFLKNQEIEGVGGTFGVKTLENSYFNNFFEKEPLNTFSIMSFAILTSLQQLNLTEFFFNKNTFDKISVIQSFLRKYCLQLNEIEKQQAEILNDKDVFDESILIIKTKSLGHKECFISLLNLQYADLDILLLQFQVFMENVDMFRTFEHFKILLSHMQRTVDLGGLLQFKQTVICVFNHFEIPLQNECFSYVYSNKLFCTLFNESVLDDKLLNELQTLFNCLINDAKNQPQTLSLIFTIALQSPICVLEQFIYSSINNSQQIAINIKCLKQLSSLSSYCDPSSKLKNLVEIIYNSTILSHFSSKQWNNLLMFLKESVQIDLNENSIQLITFKEAFDNLYLPLFGFSNPDVKCIAKSLNFSLDILNILLKSISLKNRLLEMCQPFSLLFCLYCCLDKCHDTISWEKSEILKLKTDVLSCINQLQSFLLDFDIEYSNQSLMWLFNSMKNLNWRTRLYVFPLFFNSEFNLCFEVIPTAIRNSYVSSSSSTFSNSKDDNLNICQKQQNLIPALLDFFICVGSSECLRVYIINNLNKSTLLCITDLYSCTLVSLSKIFSNVITSEWVSIVLFIKELILTNVLDVSVTLTCHDQLHLLNLTLISTTLKMVQLHLDILSLCVQNKVKEFFKSTDESSLKHNISNWVSSFKNVCLNDLSVTNSENCEVFLFGLTHIFSLLCVSVSQLNLSDFDAIFILLTEILSIFNEFRKTQKVNNIVKSNSIQLSHTKISRSISMCKSTSLKQYLEKNLSDM